MPPRKLLGAARFLPHYAHSRFEGFAVTQLLLILSFGLACQLLDAIERNLLGIDERALGTHRADQAFLHEMEFADRLARKHGTWVESRLALERGAELAQRRVLAHATDEPRGDLVARLVV